MENGDLVRVCLQIAALQIPIHGYLDICNNAKGDNPQVSSENGKYRKEIKPKIGTPPLETYKC